MMLTRDQVEIMLTGLVQDKIDGINVQRLLDHDAAQRAFIDELQDDRKHDGIDKDMEW